MAKIVFGMALKPKGRRGGNSTRVMFICENKWNSGVAPGTFKGMRLDTRNPLIASVGAIGNFPSSQWEPAND